MCVYVCPLLMIYSRVAFFFFHEKTSSIKEWGSSIFTVIPLFLISSLLFDLNNLLNMSFGLFDAPVLSKFLLLGNCFTL
jgi:hypothetical protein